MGDVEQEPTEQWPSIYRIPVTYSVHNAVKRFQHNHVSFVKLFDGLNECGDIFNLCVASDGISYKPCVPFPLSVISFVVVIPDAQLNRPRNIIDIGFSFLDMLKLSS